jgi:hypothetical protein
MRIALCYVFAIVVATGAGWIAQWIFGPYGHWTLWVRVPLVTALFAGYIAIVWWDVRRRSRS